MKKYYMKAFWFNNLKEEYRASIICKNLGMLVEIKGDSLYIWSEYDMKIENTFNCKNFLSSEYFLKKIDRESIDIFTGRAIMFFDVSAITLNNEYYIYSKSFNELDAIVTACEEKSDSYFRYTLDSLPNNENLIEFYINFGFEVEDKESLITISGPSNREKIFKLLCKSDKEGWINL